MSARAYAERLVAVLGDEVSGEVSGDLAVVPTTDVYEGWAASGAMMLTGEKGGPPRAPGWPVAPAMTGAAAALALITEHLGCRVDVDGPALLGERAAHAGLRRGGTVSPGGSCRLLPARDGWLAVNLPRRYDLDALPAWLGCPLGIGEDPWALVQRQVSAGRVEELEERAVLLDLPVARLPDGVTSTTTAQPVPFVVMAGAARRRRPRPLIVDLSSMWAGPLCANLLGLAGGRVVKVESATRPDGARSGTPSFFHLLHGGEESVVIPFEEASGRDALRRLVSAADVVIDSSRPRAMDQLGVEPLEVVSSGATWVSLTAYGRGGSWPNRVGFGDDVAVAAGLVAGPRRAPLMCGDAAADPIAGLHAAVAAAGSLLSGRSHLIDVSMRDAVASTLGASREKELVASEAGVDWSLNIGTASIPVAAPRSRAASGAVRPSGADTDAVLSELG
jgi:hypothetical protein